MKPVALDATLWDEPITGIALYVRELSLALQAAGTTVERWGAARSGEQPRRDWSRSWWTVGRLPGLLQTERPRLYHAVANFNLPLRPTPGVPFVLTVHDLVPLLLPDTVSRAYRWQFRAWLASSLRVADAVICVSEVTRQSLLAQFEVSPERVTVIHHGVDHVLRAAPDRTTDAWLDSLGLKAPWVLYAGSLDARKNVQLLLAAIERLHRGGRRLTLVMAGQRWFGSGPIEVELQRVRAAGVDIRPLGYLADPVFYALMRRAGVFVFPSRYEGFGLPPLEAMRLGVPTIVSSGGSLPEVCGSAALQVEPDDVEGLAGHLDRLLDRPEVRQNLSERGLAHATSFTWARTAQATAEVYARLSGDPAQR